MYCYQVIYTQQTETVGLMAQKVIELWRPYRLTQNGILRILRKMFSDVFIGEVICGNAYHNGEVTYYDQGE